MSKFRKLFVHAINLLLSTSLMFVNPDLFDPDGGYSSSGELVGLLDSNGREIIPPTYSNIDYAGHALFIASSVNESDPYVRGEDRFLFTASGEEIKVKVPEGGKFRRILWLGGIVMDSDSELKTLPPNSLLTFIKNNRYGICDVSGNEILEPAYSIICPPHDGYCMMKRTLRRKEQICTFNVLTRHTKILPVNDLAQLESASSFQHSSLFSEGLAAVRFMDAEGHAGFRYVDVDGKIVSGPLWDVAGPFIKGVASVGLFIDKPKTFLINKSGKVVSPARLNLEKFHGDFAVASYRKAPTKFGIVNRKFEFVIKPEFLAVQPIQKGKAFCHFYDPIARQSAPADYFLCDRSVYSSDCRFLFDFPPGCATNDVSVNDSFWTRYKDGQRVYFDLNGREIPAPPVIEHQTSQRQVHFVAPNRYVIRVNTDSGKFDSRIWALGPNKPISRIQMFGRFLEEYDLIGMSIDDVLKLLGPGEGRRYPSRDVSPTRTYVLTSGGCVPSSALLLKLTITNNKVEGWCFSADEKDSATITSNVLISSGGPYNRIGPRTTAKYTQGKRNSLK